MSKKKSYKTMSIPVLSLSKEHQEDFVIKLVTSDNLNTLNESEDAHRHDYHIFSLVRKGIFHIEIDFESYQITAPAVVYIHPSQIHRIGKIEQAEVFLLAINTEKLNPEYLRILETNVDPTRSLPLKSAIYTILDQAVNLCISLYERKTDKLYGSILKDYCNAFVGLIVSQYQEQLEHTESLSRYQILSNEFKLLLERDFILHKQPSDYAAALNISTAYLNECVRNATGVSVSRHIHQRIVLEAKRLLFYSDRSVKEIATELGYDDYPYFCRIFAKITGTTALAFRNKIAS